MADPVTRATPAPAASAEPADQLLSIDVFASVPQWSYSPSNPVTGVVDAGANIAIPTAVSVKSGGIRLCA